MAIMDWHNRFSDMARLVATWSKDPSTQVGAVIVRNRVIVSTGYNGLPKGVEDLAERLNDRSQKYPMTVHAELNAILQATSDLQGSSIYVTHHPCARCAGAIIQAGISEVYITGSKSGLRKNWDTELKMARQMFFETKIAVYDLQDLSEAPTILAAE